MATEFFVFDLDENGDAIERQVFDEFADAAKEYNKWVAWGGNVACVVEKRVTGRDGVAKRQVMAFKGDGEALEQGGWTAEGRDQLQCV